ncbi:MAG: hypothetical protein OES57_04785 [Acidimicrobiia bacterium]|nr:hypothetical protein [Acidimicrobiia bacterium]
MMGEYSVMGPKRRGVYPGSFNPPTVAHLAIAHRASQLHSLDVVVWAVSEVALTKGSVDRPSFEHRVAVLREEAAAWPWLEVEITGHQLIADIAAGYDVVIMGADKWHQVHDVAFYADSAARDAAVASLPTVAVAPRAGLAVPPAVRLDVPDEMASVSSSRARGGAVDTMAAAARRFDRETGAWSDPERFERWLRS